MAPPSETMATHPLPRGGLQLQPPFIARPLDAASQPPTGGRILVVAHATRVVWVNPLHDGLPQSPALHAARCDEGDGGAIYRLFPTPGRQGVVARAGKNLAPAGVKSRPYPASGLSHQIACEAPQSCRCPPELPAQKIRHDVLAAALSHLFMENPPSCRRRHSPDDSPSARQPSVQILRNKGFSQDRGEAKSQRLLPKSM